MDYIRMIKQDSMFVVCALFSIVYCLCVSIVYSSQPIIDLHAFRQSQTALTVYWMVKEGFLIPYQTPVVGYPWSIPFEFPIYQIIVAVVVKLFAFELEQVGRIVSCIFLIACLIPVGLISKKYKLSNRVVYIFSVLFLTSPLYVYWGRSFMIETTALFFSLLSLYFGLCLIDNFHKKILIFAYVFFSIISIVQKATTEIPIVIFLVIISLYNVYITKNKLNAIMHKMGYILFPMVIGYLWVFYTDSIKEINVVGSYLTSSALSGWNFGGIDQRISLKTWESIFISRSFDWVSVGFFGSVLLMLPFLFKINKERRTIVILSLILFVLPLGVFTNLHYVHDYYQVSCVVYLIFGLSVMFGYYTEELKFTNIILVILVVVAILNIYIFNKKYSIIYMDVTEKCASNTESYKIGRYLDSRLGEDSAVVVYGADWSSEIAFHSRRKCMTVPDWCIRCDDVAVNQNKYLGELKLGAIVIMPGDKKNYNFDFGSRVYDGVVSKKHICNSVVLMFE